MITNTEIGRSIKLKGVLGRIVEHNGSYGDINGTECNSIVTLCTPHGSEIKSGIAFLDDLTQEEEISLLQFEIDAKTDGKYYNGKIS